MKDLILESFISESIHDKGLLKAIILCGGPGAGKSYVVNKFIQHLEPKPKIFDSDKILEYKLMKRKLSFKWAAPESEEFKKQWKAREEALSANTRNIHNAIEGYLPLILDGTGQHRDKTIKRKKILEELGYDVMMIMVKTSIDVAQERNAKRERSLKPYVVENIWKSVLNNIPLYQVAFDNFYVAENDPGQLDDVQLEKVVKKFWNSPLKNPIGVKLLQSSDTPTYRSIPKELIPEQLEIIENIREILESSTEVLVEDSWIQKLFNKLKGLFDQKKVVDIDIGSEAISHINYDPRSKILRLTFTKNDRTYAYRNVDQKSVFRLLASTNTPGASVGREFHANVRSNPTNFPYREVLY